MFRHFSVKAVSKSGRIYICSPEMFYADHPFVYYLKFQDIVVFVGALRV